jgi:HEAT repeat protein
LAEFERVLGRGLGRAVLFLRQHDARPYRDAILHACTHWTGYDQQVEGTRTIFLRDVLDATGHEHRFVPRILAALKGVTDRRDAIQLVFLVLAFAKDGYDEARTALYEAFDRNDTEEAFLGFDAIIRLDGLEGFRYVAERMGAALLNDPHASVEADHARWEAKEAVGEEAVQRVLAEADTPALRAFVQALEWDDEDRPVRSAALPKPDDATYEQVRQVIATSRPSSTGVLGLRRWGEHASADDLAQAAADLLDEEDDHRLISHLRIFEWRAFPLTPDRLLRLMDHPDVPLMLAASRALSQVADPRVRALGLEILADPDRHGARKSAGAQLLVASYQAGDEAILIDLLRSQCDEDARHWIGMGAIDILKANPSASAVPVLYALYEYGPCSFCRWRSVGRLRKLGKLPDWMLEECRYDANLDLSDAADAWSRGEEPADD